MARFRQVLWLLVLGLWFATAVPAPASVFGSGGASRPGGEVGSINACAFVTLLFDAPSRGGISYDRVALRDYVYDAASMRAAGEQENGTVGDCAVFAKFAEFLAAKTGTTLVDDLAAAATAIGIFCHIVAANCH